MSSRQNSNPARLALAFALAGMAMSSCETGKKLADFGPVKLDSFGTGAVPTATSPASPPQTAARPPAVISSTDPVVMMARAQAAGGTYRPAPQSAPPAPSTVAYQPGPTAPSFSTLDSAEALKSSIPKQFVVKTTAYSHLEADSLQYGTKSALGDDLKFGRVRSAAADWSRYPVGTKFKIKGLPYEYVVDDYGSALVGTDTIDLYKPNLGMMDQWGARNVGIEVLEWGSFEESKRILEGRKHKPDAHHVRKMLNNIEQKIKHLPEVLRDGFRA
jgi:3D (Asp-Asp-Asp) domain-containing protein